jgi:hypothetical protein
MPLLVRVAGHETIVGFDHGTLRDRVMVPGMAITRHPITVREYRACVRAGACSPPELGDRCSGGDHAGVVTGPTYGDADSELPVTCTSEQQAAAYCKWVEGSLPTLPQWQLAARGPEVHAYSWGDTPPTCARHPSATGILSTSTSCCPASGACDLGRVGAHAEGRSPSGIEDVLLSPAELVRSGETSAFACSAEVCAVRGDHGRIESIQPVRQGAQVVPTSFRCVLQENGR